MLYAIIYIKKYNVKKYKIQHELKGGRDGGLFLAPTRKPKTLNSIYHRQSPCYGLAGLGNKDL